MTTVLREEHRRARKDHLCDDCHGIIKKGASYDYQACAGGGEVWNWKRCGRCAPGDDSGEGAWLRPEDAWANPGQYPAIYEDCAITIYGHLMDEGGWDRDLNSESVMVPLVGMMEWVEVCDE